MEAMKDTQSPSAAWLFDAEYSLMELVWENAPVGSTRLAALAAGQLGWKKSTTYTVLRKLAGRGVLENRDATVRPLITRQQALRAQAEPVLARCGGLSGFLTAFFDGEPISDAEADRLKALIDASRARQKDGKEQAGQTGAAPAVQAEHAARPGGAKTALPGAAPVSQNETAARPGKKEG